MEKKAAKDPVVEFVVEQARRLLNPRRIILFGSRARGDASETSDYDIAFDLADNKSNWSFFSSEAEEKTPTLKKLDLITDA